MTIGEKSIRFSHAITRAPCAAAVAGLRAIDTGTPDLERFLQHHAAYVAALRDTGATVEVLEPLDEFPDSVFVEDTALCLPELAIIMRPGAPSRLGEASAMMPYLREHFSTVAEVMEPAFIEGGDILVTGSEILVGTSARTNRDGIAALTSFAAYYGHRVRAVETPPGVLHFKTDCSLLDPQTVLSTARLAASGCFAGYRVIETADGEEASANAIRFNDVVLMADGFPATADKLAAAGYDIRRIGNSEAAKLDGGMSCLSLRFTPNL